MFEINKDGIEMKKPRNISKNINSIIPIISFDSLFNLKCRKGNIIEPITRIKIQTLIK